MQVTELIFLIMKVLFIFTCLSTINLLSPEGHNLQESESMTSARRIFPKTQKYEIRNLAKAELRHNTPNLLEIE